MFFLCPSTSIVSVVFLIELNLFCFPDLYLVMILAGVNFKFWLHIPYVESGRVPVRSLLRWSWSVLNSSWIHWLFWCVDFFLSHKTPYLSFHFHHRTFFSSSLFSYLWTGFRAVKVATSSLYIAFIDNWAWCHSSCDMRGDKALDANQLLYRGDTTFLWQIFD